MNRDESLTYKQTSNKIRLAEVDYKYSANVKITSRISRKQNTGGHSFRCE